MKTRTIPQTGHYCGSKLSITGQPRTKAFASLMSVLFKMESNVYKMNIMLY